jgi:diketogulonate reductase-like aldo/keto reductase
VIPGTVIPEQIVENMKATEIVLDDNDMTRLRCINKDLRFIDVCKPNEQL